MSWLWAFVIPLILGPILLFRPLLISCDFFPFLLRVSWFGLGFHYDDKITLLLFGKKLALKKKEKEEQTSQKPTKVKIAKAKEPKKKKKKSFKTFSISLVKEIWELKTGQLIAKRLIRLCKNIFKSFSIKKITGDIGALDYYQTGVLYGLLESVPNHNKLDLKANFQGVQAVNLSLNVSLAKVVLSLIQFLVTFPYFKTWKLYNFLLKSNNASKSR